MVTSGAWGKEWALYIKFGTRPIVHSVILPDENFSGTTELSHW